MYLGIYLLAGLFYAHFQLKDATKRVNEEYEKGEVSDEAREISEGVERLSGAIGYRNVLIVLYSLFSAMWLPIAVYRAIKRVMKK